MIVGKQSRASKIFDAANVIFMIVILLLTLYPLWYVVVGSFNKGLDFMKGGVYFFPRAFTLENYKAVLREESIYRAFGVTALRTVIGTVGHIVVVLTFAYGFYFCKLTGKNFYAILCLIPMFVAGGTVPYYQVIVKLHLNNTFWVYILPGLFSYWNVLIVRTFFTGIPEALVESARIEGAGEYRILWQIVFPISLPVVAALVIFTSVGHWNSYFASMIFMSSRKELYTLQHIVMKLVTEKDAAKNMASSGVNLGIVSNNVTSDSIQFASIIVSILPIVAVYPFMQKYFIKGVLIGSVKG